jgi:hypothetical protein
LRPSLMLFLAGFAEFAMISCPLKFWLDRF